MLGALFQPAAKNPNRDKLLLKLIGLNFVLLYIQFKFKVEVAHPYPHEVLVFHGVISNSEAEDVINEALPRIRRAPVGNYKSTSYHYQ